MSLPDWDADGLLPAGPAHPATIDDVYERFVQDAPNRGRRETLHGALVTHLAMVRTFIPAGRLWIDGGFSMRKTTPPHDVDVVIHPADWGAFADLPDQSHYDIQGLLTLQDVIVGSLGPMYLERVQPVGGALDAFLCYPGQEDVWHATWSSVRNDNGEIVPGTSKGYAEVSW